MEITARGWNRDMGNKEICSIDVSELMLSKDQNRTVYRDRPAMFGSYPTVEVHWFKQLHLTGNYRMELRLTQSEVIRLFKGMFGTELRPWLIEQDGFTVSPELTRAILAKVKLTDLTLGELAAMTGAGSKDTPSAQEKNTEPEATKPVLRSV
jgi:hypothetical protein